MEDELIRLLEKIEKAGLKGIGKIQLKNELKESDAPIAPHLTEKLIKEAHSRGLIRDDTGNSKPEDSSDRDDMVCVLTIAGFEFLNQIWIKKAIVKFNESSDESYEKIINLTDKLGFSVDKLHQSSNRLEYLTLGLIILTIFLAGLTVIGLLSEGFSLLGRAFLIIIVTLLALFYLYRWRPK